jgi:HK97 family phage prohead protease
MTLSNRAQRLNGVRETRSIVLDEFEFRAGSSGDTLEFQGYASLFNVGYEMYGGPDKGGWTEYVDPKAFDRTLSAKPDVVLNINHGEGGTGLPLARTTSGTLALRTDKKGLLPSASLDLRDPDVQALQVKVERGDVNQMSFAFRTIRQEWNNDEEERRLLELSLDRGDVSIVTNGANPKTSVSFRGLDEAIQYLNSIDASEAEAEVRAWVDDDALAGMVSAHALLGQLLARDSSDEEEDITVEDETTPVRKLSVAQARRLAVMSA